jgi:hypothetical protein
MSTASAVIKVTGIVMAVLGIMVAKEIRADNLAEKQKLRVENDEDHFYKRWDFYAKIHGVNKTTEHKAARGSEFQRQVIRPVFCNGRKAFFVSLKEKNVIIYDDSYISFETKKNGETIATKSNKPLDDFLAKTMIRASAWD